jgi:hypothetical protein
MKNNFFLYLKSSRFKSDFLNRYIFYIPRLFLKVLSLKFDFIFPELFKSVGVIFVHIPKNAGTSISLSLYGRTFHHRTFKSFRYCSFHENIKSFALVRNPWDRLVSAYFFLKNKGSSSTKVDELSLQQVNLESFDSFVYSLIGKNLLKLDPVLHPQTHYLFDSQLKNVDFIYKFEDIFNLEKSLCNDLGIKVTVSKCNQGVVRGDYHEFYNDDILLIVNDLYSADINYLEYEF